jgi:hypothetical protein
MLVSPLLAATLLVETSSGASAASLVSDALLRARAAPAVVVAGAQLKVRASGASVVAAAVAAAVDDLQLRTRAAAVAKAVAQLWAAVSAALLACIHTLHY